MSRLRHFTRILCALLALSVSISHTGAQEATPETTPESEAPLLQRPAVSASVSEAGVTLETLFDETPQGRVGLFYLTGPDLVSAEARFVNESFSFFPVDADDDASALYGLLAVDMDRNARAYDIQVIATLTTGERINLPARVNVTLGGFLRQPDLTVPPDRAYLIDPEVERSEFALLRSITDPYTETRYWADAGFQPPINSELTSPFGSFRVFNGSVPARHTGWDLRAPVGTPVTAMAAGKVAFAGRLDIRGNYVMIDHGYGVYSGYAHFSQVHVTRGQTLRAGQVIGVSGDTGRSGGAHLHWEISVNGHWVDSVDFLRTWIP